MNLYRKELSYYINLILICCFPLSFAQAPDTFWTKTYGGGDHDEGRSVQETFDCGYVITGYTRSFTPGIYLIKTDIYGDTLWTKIFETPPLATGGWSVQQTIDGGYIVAGDGGGDVWMIKTDSLGDTLWTRMYGGQGGNICHAIIETSDSGFAFIWDRQVSPGGFLIRLTKLDANGYPLWFKNYAAGYSFALQQTSDGGYIISGQSSNNVYLIKTDTSGDTLWTKMYGDDFHWGRSVQQTPDDGYIVTGDKGADVFLMKTDSLGDSVWTKTYGGDGSDIGHSVMQTSDAGYIIAGYTNSFGAGNSDVYLIKTDNNGDTLWTTTWGGTDQDEGCQVLETFDGNYIITGYTASFGAGNCDVWLLKVGTEVGVEEENTVVEKNGYGATIVSGPLILPKDKKCRVFDITGRVVEPDRIRPGIYFIEIDGVVVQKVIKIR